MRKLTLTLLLFAPLALLAQGIRFDESQQWQNILMKAKEENKVIFVDAYTTWCGPCKQMSKEIFPQAEAGKFYNDNFINVKLDMEKGEGVDFASTYNVHSYPQLLFINPEGELIHYGVGSMPVTRLVQLGRDALDPQKQIGALKAQFTAGTLNLDGKRSLAAAAAGREPMLMAQLADDILTNDRDWSTKENIMLMVQLLRSPSGEYFDYLWKNRRALDAKYGAEAKKGAGPDLTLSLERMVLGTGTSKYPNFKKSAADSTALAAYFAGYFTGADTIAFQMLHADMLMALQMNNVKGVLARVQAIEQHKKMFGGTELNEMAWLIFEKGKTATPKELEMALEWAKQSAAETEAYANTDTVANLYNRLGNKAEAKKWAEKSIALGKAAGEDTADTEKLLKSL